MEKIHLALQVLILESIGLFILFLRKYFPTYITKKAENLATKEDIGEITHRVEEVRTQHLAALERMKSGLSDESAALLRRRQIYEETVKALRIFIAGANATDTQKQVFLSITRLSGFGRQTVSSVRSIDSWTSTNASPRTQMPHTISTSIVPSLRSSLQCAETSASQRANFKLRSISLSVSWSPERHGTNS